MSELELLQLGQPLLRRKAKPVSDIHADRCRQIIELLTEQVIQRQGMGIAATQLGFDQQIFIMCSHSNDRYPDAPEMPITTVINPQILSSSEHQISDWEGCLSIPGLRAKVSRPQSIEVAYTLQDGTKVQTRYDGFLARLFQHEYDHLQGLLFIDRVSSTDDMMTEKVWQQQYASRSRNTAIEGTQHGAAL